MGIAQTTSYDMIISSMYTSCAVHKTSCLHTLIPEVSWEHAYAEFLFVTKCEDLISQNVEWKYLKIHSGDIRSRLATGYAKV